MATITDRILHGVNFVFPWTLAYVVGFKHREGGVLSGGFIRNIRIFRGIYMGTRILRNTYDNRRSLVTQPQTLGPYNRHMIVIGS